ncbi:hypothetical protein BD770DRAFT_400757 [Pilaira anomala]|nr:hypothetical protein BD770DRAFT_400757 [Pilaira anomala]
MSINSFFQTRKSRTNKTEIESTHKQDASTLSSIQAPQPIYDYEKKPVLQLPPPQQQTVCKKSILYYLSPIKNKTETTTTVEELPCRIRTNLPVSSLWKHIIEEFDPDSQPNQFSIDSHSSFSFKKEQLLLEEMDISSPRHENKRRMLQENDDQIRVR